MRGGFDSRWDYQFKRGIMFKITSMSAVGAKSIAKIYQKMGYKHISTKYDNKKEVYINTFK